MKNLLVILLFIAGSFLGCSKKQKAINRMNGTWEIVTYRQTYISGLTSEIESEGTILFTDFNPKKETGFFGQKDILMIKQIVNQPVNPEKRTNNM